MPELEFIADMNISPLTVEELRKKGWNIVRVSEIMSVKTKDLEILIFAKKNNKVLISQDLDFSMLLAVGGYKKPSVINLRLNNTQPNFITMRIIEVVYEMEKEYKRLIALLDPLIDEAGEYENHPFASLMDIIGTLIEKYENDHVPVLL